jgi:hypothetical protein
MELSIKILDRNGNILAQNTEQYEANLVYHGIYQEGDKIIITSSAANRYLMVQVDDALGSAFVYITEQEFLYHIPFQEKRSSYSPKVFSGDLHLLWVRAASKEEIREYKNLALNVMDQHEAKGCYPHAAANVETRGEAVFAARNAIDGVRENHSHGEWPYQSWGINKREDARMRLDFGRKVMIDQIVLYTRADFPHDSWWKEVTLLFSDGTRLQWFLEKTDKAHTFKLAQKEILWLELCELIKADDSSPFPALSQIEVYGVEAER